MNENANEMMYLKACLRVSAKDIGWLADECSDHGVTSVAVHDNKVNLRELQHRMEAMESDCDHITITEIEKELETASDIMQLEWVDDLLQPYW